MRVGNIQCGAMAASILGLMAASTASAQYVAGDIWNRSADWVDGTAHGSTENNPGPDFAGNDVWSYEHVSGQGLASENPWYGQSSELMTWDSAWYNIGYGAWSVDDDVNPPIFSNRLTHNLAESSFETSPMVRWTSPVEGSNMFSIAGALNILWSGQDFMGSAVDVDIVLAVDRVDGFGPETLMATTVSKPINGDSVGDTVQIELDLEPLFLAEGDSLILTHRGQESMDSHWIVMEDAMTVTLVPAPGAGALLGLSGLALIRRRR